MPEMYKGKIPIIKRSLDEGWIRGLPDGETFGTGCIERDFDIDPVAVGDSPAEMQLIPDSEWDARWEESEETESSLEHLFLRGEKPAFELLNQNGFPDCWAYSTAHALMFSRLKQAPGMSVVRLNATAVATMLRQTNGGWCGLSGKFAREHGYPAIGNGVGEWPELTRKGKDTPELRANMALHKSTEDWYDFGRREYNQVLTQRQLMTQSFNNNPSPADWMPYGHSMMIARIVRVEKGRWLPLIFQSYKGWGYHGFGVLPIWPNNAISIRDTTASVR